MNLIETITFRKQELAEVITQLSVATDRKAYLKNEIADLEYQMQSERINNPVACLNPIVFSLKECGQRGFNNQCSYRGKGDYGRFKL